MATEAWTVRRLLEWTEGYFREKGVESPRLEAQILLAHILGCRKIDLYVRHDEVLSDAKRAEFRAVVQQRAEGKPTAYLVGSREFYSLEFAVASGVLIPRPDTETLVVESLERLKPLPAPTILDLGTGSGCLAVALAVHHPGARVTAVEIDPSAAEIAGGNARKHGVADRIEFLVGDFFTAVPDRRFDFIVSNPPYIPTDVWSSLDRTVRDYEPRSALDGGADGLDFYRRLVVDSPRYLTGDGQFAWEIGYDQADAVRALISEQTGLECTKLAVDTAGRHRVVAGRVRSI